MDAVPAFEACQRRSCGKGDTTTAFGARGPAVFHRTVLTQVLGWPQDEAEAAIYHRIVNEDGHDPADPPASIEFCYRLCCSCAKDLDCPVAELDPSSFHQQLPGITAAEVS